jgi:hypothetical protein
VGREGGVKEDAEVSEGSGESLWEGVGEMRICPCDF